MSSDSILDLSEAQRERADQLHEKSTVVDGLIPTSAYISAEGYQDHLHRGGVTVGNFTVASRTVYPDATRRVQRFRDQIVAHADDFLLVESADDIDRAKRTNRVGAILGFQDTMPIAPTDRMQLNDDTEFLRAFYHMGVRIVQLTYNSLNYVGAGCCERVDPGVSNFGRQLIDGMNQLGILVDLSHCGDETTLEAAHYSDKPVVASHANARSVSNVGRNKTDEQIQAIAETGGLIGISVFPPLVKSDFETHEVHEATIHEVLDHIDYVVDLVGVDHVGFGSDMNDKALDDGMTPPYAAYRNFRPEHSDVYGSGPIEEYEPFPRGLHRHTKLRNLARGLVARGYSDGDVQKILGGNFVRVFEKVWEE